MKSFVGKFFGRGEVTEVSPAVEEVPPQTPEEIYAFDLRLLKQTGIPFYPLSQALLNEKESIHRPLPEKRVELPEEEEESPPPPAEIEMGPSRYADEKAIGEGGTAVVFRATDTRLNREIALKRFKRNSKQHENADYLAELESVSRIRHPNVVSTFDADQDAKGSFIVMELIDGMDVEVLITEGSGTFDVNRFVNFAIQSLEGLLATHQGGLLHLDLKPANIMVVKQVSGRDVVKIVDYGRALLIEGEDGSLPKGRGMDGSIYYSAPEQLLGEDLDVRTDLYALGCVFYWVLSGKRAYDGDSAVEIMAAHMQHIVKPLREVKNSVPKWLSRWVMKLISQEREKRPQSVQEAINLLMEGGDAKNVTRLKAK